MEIKCQLDATEVLLHILLLAQHVSGTTKPIIRSSGVLYSGCCLCYLVPWFFKLLVWCGAEGYVFGLQDAAASTPRSNLDLSCRPVSPNTGCFSCDQKRQGLSHSVTRSIESRSAYKFLFGNLERKRFEDIKLDLKGKGWGEVDWINLNWDGDKHDSQLVAFMQWYRGAYKSLARPGRKQATATGDFDVYISYL